MIESISRMFQLFTRFPIIGKSLALERHPNVRTFAVEQHLIFYRPVGGEIRVLRIIHASSDALAIFDQG
jgi:plasmid stabilization system protein ParE